MQPILTKYERAKLLPPVIKQAAPEVNKKAHETGYFDGRSGKV